MSPLPALLINDHLAATVLGNRDDLELLVTAPVPCPLYHICAIDRTGAQDLKNFAAIPVDDPEETAAKRFDRPFIVGVRAALRPLNYVRALGRRGALHHHRLAAVALHDPEET